MKVYIYDKEAVAKKFDAFMSKQRIGSITELAKALKISKDLTAHLYVGEPKAINEETLECISFKLGLLPHVHYLQVEAYGYQHLHCTLVGGDVVNNSSAHDNYVRLLQKKKIEERKHVHIKNDVINKSYPGFKFVRTYPNFNLWEYTSLSGDKFKVTFPINVAPAKDWMRGV